MKTLLLSVTLLFMAVSVDAYNPIVAEPPRPYAPIFIEEDPIIEQEYLGDLSDYPEMFEITSDEPFTLTVKIKQKATSAPILFSLIAIQQNNEGGGITEVFRHVPGADGWTEVSDSTLGMKFLESEPIEAQVEAGTYRVEISTALNKGDYMLVFGTEENDSNYFQMLSHIRTTQAHFGYSWLSMLRSSYVYYPIGIILILFGIYKTWQRRKKITHAT